MKMRIQGRPDEQCSIGPTISATQMEIIAITLHLTVEFIDGIM